MEQVCEYKTPENFRKENHNFEESEIGKGFDLTYYNGFIIKNCRILIDSFSINLTEEEKKKIESEILDFYKAKPNNSDYTFKTQTSFIQENKTYIYEFIFFIKKIDDEKADIQCGKREINISNANEIKDMKDKEKSPGIFSWICQKIHNLISDKKDNNKSPN